MIKINARDCDIISVDKKTEREFLESIMSHLNLPTDKESVDKEINNCVGLYELI